MSLDLDTVQGALAARAPTLEDPARVSFWAAVALVLSPCADHGLEALLIRRAERDGDPWSGHMALPGGRREPADPDLEATARREAHEETGLDLAAARFLGQLDDLHPVTRTLPPLVVRPFVFGYSARPAVLANHEVADHVWTPLAALRAERVRSRVLVRGEPREVPSVRLGDHVLWGITLRILDGFFERLLR